MIDHLSVNDILRTGDVNRWHIVRTYRNQTLAEHMYRTTLLAMKLAAMVYNPIPDELERELLWYGLLHDVHEIDYGDIPTPAKALLGITDDRAMDAVFWKRRGGELPSNSKEATVIMKLADKIEGLVFFMQNAPHQTVNNANVADSTVSGLVDYARLHTTKQADWLRVVHKVLTDLGYTVHIKGDKHGA